MALIVTVDDQDFKVECEVTGSDISVSVNGVSLQVSLVGRRGDNEMTCLIDNKPYLIELSAPDQIRVNGEYYTVSAIDEKVRSIIRSAGSEGHKKDLVIKAPMPGLVLEVMVNPGDEVAAGQGLMIIEAMKMQNDVKAPRKGRVKGVAVKKGQTVNSGDAIIVIVQ